MESFDSLPASDSSEGLPTKHTKHTKRDFNKGSPRCWRFKTQTPLAALALAVAAATVTHAQLPAPHLAWIFPAGAIAGSTNEITLAGSDLDDPTGLHCSDPRITATPHPGTSTVFTLVVPTNVPPGSVDVRFTGRFGVSSPLTLRIGSLPGQIVPPTNTTPATAVPIDRGHTVHTHVAAGAVHWFRFDARRGERLVARALAAEIDSRLVPNLAVFDAAGTELVRTRRLGWIDFTAANDGPFLLQLADHLFRGGDDYGCQLELTAGPVLDFAVPTVLRSGATNRVALHGRNLPGSRRSAITGVEGVALEEVSVDIVAPESVLPAAWPSDRLRRPASATLDIWDWAWSATNGVSNPLLFTLSTNPVVAGAPARAPDARGRLLTQLTPVTPPVEFSSLFPQAGEVSGITFAAQKGDVYFLELVAERLGLPVDPNAVVQREVPGKTGSEFTDVIEFIHFDANAGGAEFNTTSRDSMARFEAPETGNYRVLVRDPFHASPSSARRPYRLSVRRPRPDFQLVAWPTPPPKANNDDRNAHPGGFGLRRGQTVGVRVAVFRQDGFNDDLQITATGLPWGVTAATTRLAAGQGSGWLLLTAAENAPESVTEVQIVGNTPAGSGPTSRPARWGAVKWQVPDVNNEPVIDRLTRQTLLGVVGESAPITVTPTTTNPIVVVAGTKFTVPFGIMRRYEFPAAFTLKASGHSALEKVPELKIGEKATNAVLELNLGDAALSVGRHTLWLQGQIAGKYRNQPEAVERTDAALKAAEKALAAAPADKKAAAEQQRKDAEAAKKAAEERAKPRDVTLAVWSAPFVVQVTPAAPPADKK